MLFTESEIKKMIQEEILKENILKNVFNKLFNRPEKISAKDIIVKDDSGYIDPDVTSETRKAFETINLLVSQGMPREEAFRQIISKELKDIKKLAGLEISPIDAEKTSKQIRDYQATGRKSEISKARRNARNEKDKKRKANFLASKIAQRAMEEIPTEITPKDFIKETFKMKLTNDILREIILEEINKQKKLDEGALDAIKGFAGHYASKASKVVSGGVNAAKLSSIKGDVSKKLQSFEPQLTSIANTIRDFNKRAQENGFSLSPELNNVRKFALTANQAINNVSESPDGGIIASKQSSQQSAEQPNQDVKKEEEPNKGDKASESEPGGTTAVGGETPVGGTPSGPVKAPESVASINPSADKGKEEKTAPQQATRKSFGQEISGEGPKPASAAGETPASAQPAASTAPAAAQPAASAAGETTAAAQPAAAEAPKPPNMSAAQLIDSSFNSNDPDLKVKGLSKPLALKIINVLNNSMEANIQEVKGKSTPQQLIQTVADQSNSKPYQVRRLLMFLAKHGKLSSDQAKRFGIELPSTAAQQTPDSGQGKLSVGAEYADPKKHKMYEEESLNENLISRNKSSKLSDEQARRMKVLAGIIK